MTLIITSGKAAALTLAGTENHPIIAWDAITPSSTATVDGSLVSGSSADNPFSGSTYDRWLATTSGGTVALSASFAAAENMEFCAVASHNAGSLGLGVSVERLGASRTNLLPRSQDFSTGWSGVNATLNAAAAQAPDRSTTAGELVENSSTAARWAISTTSISYTSGTVYVASCYAKRGAGSRHFAIAGPSGVFGASIAAGFDLDTGVATVSTAGTSTTAGMSSVGNGWYRCWLSSQATATTSSNGVTFQITNNSAQGNASYLGDGTSSVYLWGAQIESGSRTDYLMTVASAVTSGWRGFLGWEWPTDDKPIGWYFEQQSSFGWRWRFTNVGVSDVVSVGVAFVGGVLTMDRPLYQGYAPIIRPTEVELQSNVSAGGHLLGSSVVKRGSRLKMDFANLAASFVRGSGFTGFMDHFNAGNGSFVAWRPSKYPDDLHYFWRDGSTIRPVNSGPRDLMGLTIEGRVLEA